MREDIKKHKIIQAYCKTLSTLYPIAKDHIEKRWSVEYPALPGMMSEIQAYRAKSRKLTPYTPILERCKRDARAYLSYTLGDGPKKYDNITISIGQELKFHNYNKRSKGQHRKAHVDITLKPTFKYKVINKFPLKMMEYNLILDADEININNDHIRMFQISYADIYDGTEIENGFVAIVNNINPTIKPTMHAALRDAQTKIRNYMKKKMRNKNA